VVPITVTVIPPRSFRYRVKLTGIQVGSRSASKFGVLNEICLRQADKPARRITSAKNEEHITLRRQSLDT
jgi:hypothetical protein